MVNILLNLLEDYDAPGILVATTNLENSLDKALFRRFDDIIEIPKPGEAEIAKLLKQTLSSINISKELDWKKIAKKMNNFSAALVVKVANDAAKAAVIEGGKVVLKTHLQKVLDENIAIHR
jgi:ATP-dependent 26S proteasome regulatory subunit